MASVNRKGFPIKHLKDLSIDKLQYKLKLYKIEIFNILEQLN